MPSYLFDRLIFDGPGVFDTGEILRLFDPAVFDGPALFDTRSGAYRLTAAVGSFVFTGNAAVLAAQRVLPAAGGTFSFSGVDANLVYGHAGSYTLLALPASFSLNGISATLRYSAPSGWTNVSTSTSVWTDVNVSVSTWTNQ
jgi:hypothetical protein